MENQEKNETAVTVILPNEVQTLVNCVSVEKKDMVLSVLNTVFSKTAEWKKQIDNIEVRDIHDTVSINMADVIRKAAKDERLNFEKVFDAKRTEVQAKMIEFKTEDSLWLKAKQTMQILTKEVEDTARFKAEFVKRYEAEQKELKVQQRILQVQKFNPEIDRSEFEHMNDSTFEVFISGIEKLYNDKIEAEKKAEEERIENERLNKLENERRIEIAPYVQFVTGSNDLRNMPDEDYQKLLSSLKTAKNEYEAKQEEIRKENERLRIEAENKEKELETERIKQAKILEEQKAESERLAKIEAEKQAKIKAELKAKADAVKKEKERIEAELKEKQEKELAEKREKELAEKKRIEEEKKAAKAPVKEKLTKWVNSFSIEIPDSELLNNEIALNIKAKFDAFKKWAKSEIEKL